MKLRKELKKSLVLSLCNRFFICLLMLAFPMPSKAELIIGGEPIPPGTAAYVDDVALLEDIGLPGPGVFCYDHRANAILITAAARADARCELQMKYETEKQKIKYEFRIEKLNIRIESLTNQHKEITSIKDKEIDRLSAAALKRPNDYTAWWACGGFLVGVVSSALLFSVIK